MLHRLKYMIFDVDGTLTDGRLYIGHSGEVCKVFHVKDGYALRHLLPRFGVEPVIMTARKSEIVEIRCKELGIAQCWQGVHDKKKKLMELARDWGIILTDERKFKEIGYVGDDLIDLECMRLCSFAACPMDAAGSVREEVDYVSKKNAGDGAVRDIVEWYLAHAGYDMKMVKCYCTNHCHYNL